MLTISFFAIPVNELHEVVGMGEENLLLVTKHIMAG